MNTYLFCSCTKWINSVFTKSSILFHQIFKLFNISHTLLKKISAQSLSLSHTHTNNWFMHSISSTQNLIYLWNTLECKFITDLCKIRHCCLTNAYDSAHLNIDVVHFIISRIISERNKLEPVYRMKQQNQKKKNRRKKARKKGKHKNTSVSSHRQGAWKIVCSDIHN